MFLYGASGHAKVIIDILRANNEVIDALFDDNEEIHSLLGYPVLPFAEVKGPLIISIGDNRVRKRIATRLSLDWGLAVHPSACISEYATLNLGTVVMQGAIIQSCVTIGKHCIINTGASVDHECLIGDYVHISPNAALGGTAHIGEGTHIGIGATVKNNINICDNCIIGAGAMVVNNITESSVYVGTPAKIKNH